MANCQDYLKVCASSSSSSGVAVVALVLYSLTAGFSSSALCGLMIWGWRMTWQRCEMVTSSLLQAMDCTADQKTVSVIDEMFGKLLHSELLEC